jgi:hypothetical protein
MGVTCLIHHCAEHQVLCPSHAQWKKIPLVVAEGGKVLAQVKQCLKGTQMLVGKRSRRKASNEESDEESDDAETGQSQVEGDLKPPKRKQHRATCRIVEDADDDPAVHSDRLQHGPQEQQADDDEADDILAPLLAPANKDPHPSKPPHHPELHLGTHSIPSRLQLPSLTSNTHQAGVTVKKVPVEPHHPQSRLAAALPPVPQPASPPVNPQPTVQARARSQARSQRSRAGSAVPVHNPWLNHPGQFYQMPMYPQSGGITQGYPPSYSLMMNPYGYGMLGGMVAGPSRIQDPYHCEDFGEDQSEE